MTLIYDQTYEGKSSRFRMTMTQDFQTVVRFEGRGTVAGTRAYVDMLNEANPLLPPTGRYSSLLDCTQYQGTPLRAQLILGRLAPPKQGPY